MPNSPLAALVCGDPSSESELGEILEHLGQEIDVFMEQVDWLKDQDAKKVTVFGPFIGRSLIELSFTGLIARLDPFRVLVLRKMQQQQNFEIGVRRAASIQWTGDVLAKEQPKEPWDARKSFEKVSRALLADYYETIYWEPSLIRLLDDVESGVGGAWMDELHSDKPGNFIGRMRSEADTIYSSLSKGLHHEFVVPPGDKYDRATVANLIQDVLRISSHLGIVSHRIQHAPFGLDGQVALAKYIEVQKIEVS